MEEENLHEMIVFVRCTLTKDDQKHATFDARTRFGLLLAALKNADAKLRLCPFESTSENNAIDSMHNLPDNDAIKEYFANLKITKYNSAIATLRLETTLRIHQLRASPAVKTYLEKHNMSIRQQTLRSSVVVKAGWFLQVHPTLTYREHFKKRLYYALQQNGDVPDFELHCKRVSPQLSDIEAQQ